jgi:NAD(P)-dependent dehydrogenase (short-subunit alcohol dehydrogenase family)
MKLDQKAAIVTGASQGIRHARAERLVRAGASYVTGQTPYADGGRMVLNYTVPVRD